MPKSSQNLHGATEALITLEKYISDQLAVISELSDNNQFNEIIRLGKEIIEEFKKQKEATLRQYPILNLFPIHGNTTNNAIVLKNLTEIMKSLDDTLSEWITVAEKTTYEKAINTLETLPIKNHPQTHALIKELIPEGTELLSEQPFALVRNALEQASKHLTALKDLAETISSLDDSLSKWVVFAEETTYQEAIKKLESLNINNHTRIHPLIQELILQSNSLKKEGRPITEITNALEQTYMRLTDINYPSASYTELAQDLRKHPSPGMKILGGIMLALAVAIGVAAILFCSQLIGAGLAGTLAFTGAVIAPIGCVKAAMTFFNHREDTNVTIIMKVIDKDLLTQNIPHMPSMAAR